MSNIKDKFTEDEMKALRRLRTDYGCSHWSDTGYFDVPGVVLRGLVERGYATSRKQSPSSPAEYQGKFNYPMKATHP